MRKDEAGADPHRFPPSVRFLINKYTFIKTKISSRNLAISTLNDPETQERGLGELKSKKFPKG